MINNIEPAMTRYIDEMDHTFDAAQIASDLMANIKLHKQGFYSLSDCELDAINEAGFGLDEVGLNDLASASLVEELQGDIENCIIGLAGTLDDYLNEIEARRDLFGRWVC